ncbi:glutathione S-transferase family protein [Desulfobacterota bacterium AH_259_B03_O07]|nr:glutathione S-transferase family protein [Desulfobacterota bacterium AH_259_B03_O07]
MIKLYDHPLSGNCYKVRLLLNHLGLEYDRITVDIFKEEHKSEEFKRLNPIQKIPVLQDDGFVMWESNAILLYIAKKYSPNEYYSEEFHRFGSVSQWLFFGKTTLDPNLARARYITRFVPKEKRNQKELEFFRSAGLTSLRIVEDHLERNDYLVGSYTIADIGCYPYVNTSEEGGISLSPFPAVLKWCERISSQPGYISLGD